MPTSLNASLNVKLNAASLNASSKQIKQALGRITGQASEFQKSLDASTARVFAFGATTAVLNGVTQSFKKLVATTVEVQKRLVEINSIFQATESAFNRFRNAIFQVAKETGQSFGTVAEGAAELARQGLSAAETAERLKAALVLTRISGMDAEKSVKALTAAINGFTSAGLTANQIVNKMVAVDTAFAVSTQDLAEAFSRAGSTAEDAGVSFNELLGLITAVEQRTARGGAVIGNAFKSIFTRLSRGSTIESLKELGVSIDATQSGIQKLQSLSNALEKISDPTIASEIKELAGGVFQINVVSAALKDLGNDTSVFKNAAITAATATNEAFEKNVGLNQTISAQMNSLVQGLTSLAERVGTITFGPLIENLVGVAEKFTSFLDAALDPEKGDVFIKGFFKAIGSFLGGPAIVLFTAAFAKIVKLVAKFAVGGLKSLFAMGTQVEKIKQIEGGIVGLLGRDAALRKTITSTTATQAQKEQAIITAIQTENALLQQQAILVRSLASAAAARGVSGFGASGFTGRGGRAFAGGFQQEEAMATMLGAKNPKAHKGKGTIGGRSFTMNNRETEIPRFGRNGDSAVIPHYAGGFVPNYALMGVRSLRSQNRKRLEKIADDPNNENSANAKKILAERKAKKDAPRLPLSGAGKAMLIPRLNYERMLPSGFKGSFKKGKKTYKYSLSSGLNIRGPKIPRSIDDISDPQDEQLRPNIAKAVVKEAAKFANTLHPVTGRGVSQGKITRQLLKQGGGKGALHAIIGAAFEAAVMAGLNLSPAKRTEGGDFDVRESTTNNLADIQALFFGKGKNKTTKLMDFKASASASSGIPSFAKKIFNEQYKGGKTVPAGYAGGNIPNFAGGLTAAIEREEAAGIPVSKIRAHFGKGGRPKAVTNTKDEPRGLASLGFIPNFAKGDGGGMGNTGALMMGLFALQGALGTLTAKHEQNINAIEAEIDERNDAISVLSETTKLDENGNVIMKANLASAQATLTANKKELAQRSANTGSMVKLAESAKTAANALMTLATINMLTGGGIGKGAGAMLGFGKKGKAAWGAAAAKSAALPAVGGATRMMTTTGTAANKFGSYAARARVGAPMQFTQQQSMAQRAGRFAGKTGAKAKAFGGLAGKAAGRLGAVGALGMGAVQAWNISQDQSLHKDQKKERMGKTGVRAGMTAAGAALGTMIPIPVLGTLLGAAVGAGLGNLMTGRDILGGEKVDDEGNPVLSKADQKRANIRTSAERIAASEGSLRGADSEGRTVGFKPEEFEKLANENLEKISRAGGDADAVAQRYRDAMDNRTEILERMGAGEETTNEELLASKEELIQASMLLINSRFRTVQAFEQNAADQKRADEALVHATKELATLKEKQMKGVKDVLKEAKAKEAKASLMAGMGSAIGGKYAGAIGLASEQHLMMSQIGVAKAEKSKADREFAIGKGELPEGSDALIKLEQAATKAGQNFRDQTTKAGLNFANHIKKTEDLLEQNRKKQAELELTRQKTIGSKIEEILTGKKTGDLRPFKKMVEQFEQDMKRIDANVKRRGGKKGDYNETEQRFISKREMALEQEFARTGYGGTMQAFLSDLKKGLADVFNSTRADRLGGLRKQPKNEGGYDWDAAVKGAGTRGGETAGEAAQDLVNAEHDLMAQLGTTRSSFIALEKATDGGDGKGGVKKELDALKTAMEGAAGSFAGVKAFVGKLNASSGSTVKAIELNNTFLEKSEKVISDQTELIEALQADVDELKRAKG